MQKPRNCGKFPAALEEARAAWDGAIGAIDQTRKQQMAAPACKSPPRRRSTLDREWDGLIAHREPDDQPGQ